MTIIPDSPRRKWQVRLAPFMLSVVFIALELAALRQFPRQACFAVSMTAVIFGLNVFCRPTLGEFAILFAYAYMMTALSMPSDYDGWGTFLAAGITLGMLSLWAARLLERKKIVRVGPIDENEGDPS